MEKRALSNNKLRNEKIMSENERMGLFMSQAKGVYVKALFDFETAYGQKPATPAGFYLPIITHEIQSKKNAVESKVITGTRNPSEPARGNTDTSGSITGPLDLASFGYILKMALGNPATTGNGPYTHVFKIDGALPSWLTERGFTDINQYFLYNGCKADSLKISVGGDGELTYKLDTVGSNSVVGTTPYNAAAAAITLANKLSNFQTAVKIDGAVAANTIMSGDFTISNNLDKNNYPIGSNGFRGDIAEGLAKISGTVKTMFSDMNLVKRGIEGTTSSLEFVWNVDDTHSLSFLYPEVKFTRADPTLTGPAGVTVDLTWEAFHQNDKGNSAVIVTLKNDTAKF